MIKSRKFKKEPEKPVAGIGYLNFLRQIEQRADQKPRIGESTALHEEIVTIGQDPLMAFAEHDMSRMLDGKRTLACHITGQAVGLSQLHDE